LAAVIPIDDLCLLERLAREERDRIGLEDARAALKEAERRGPFLRVASCGNWRVLALRVVVTSHRRAGPP